MPRHPNTPVERRESQLVSGRTARRGAAVVELAVCLPVIFAVVFASIEACNMLAIKQIAVQAAYEGALLALRPRATEDDVLSVVETSLAARNVTPQSVRVEGMTESSFEQVKPGDPLQVVVEVAAKDNIAGPQLFGFAASLNGVAMAIKQ